MMPEKKMTVVAAGLGFADLERRGRTRLAGLDFVSAPSVFPALTCPFQGTLRTGLSPAGHGMTLNGIWLDNIAKPAFWEQSARLVKGPRVWEARRAAGAKVGLYFFQQSLGEAADVIVSPAPIHKHGGGMIMRNYTQPAELSEKLVVANGAFPLHRYWGPLASPRVGDACLDDFEAAFAAAPVDEIYLYLPTLDYEAQRHGPFSPQADAALDVFEKQLARVVAFAEKNGFALTVTGDYAIDGVTEGPLFPNRTLRAARLFKTRPVAGRAYPDFYASKAFAICDHELLRLVGPVADKAKETLLATGDYEEESSATGDVLLLAKKGAWCAYPWWTDPREAPDYATHIDIHNKPGYDPCELFFAKKWGIPYPATCQNASRIRGTHGRPRPIATTP